MSESLSKKTIHLATDHAGLEHKNEVKAWLESEGFIVTDHGAYEFVATDDFPDFIQLAARAVSESNNTELGIIFGGSGQGEAMAANRFKGVRATVYYGGDESIIKLSRQHNNANILSIGARFVDVDSAKKVIWDWLHAEVLQDEKYARRNDKLDQF